jgi:lipase chaperone LimK
VRERHALVAEVRGRCFSPAVAAAFFGDDEAYDQFALDRAAVLADAGLTVAQRAASLSELHARLPAAVREQLGAAEKVQTLDALTDAWRARAGSAAELRALREQVVGQSAADRLESLDRDTAAWDRRLAAYLHTREQLRRDPTLADSTRASQLAGLRQQSFDDEERVRVETLERIHDASASHAVPPSR